MLAGLLPIAFVLFAVSIWRRLCSQPKMCHQVMQALWVCQVKVASLHSEQDPSSFSK